MTNEMIIMNARLALLDAGLIGTTGLQFELIFIRKRPMLDTPGALL